MKSKPKLKHQLNPARWSENYSEYLFRFAVSRVSDHGAAEDLVQETFLAAWKAHRRFRGDCSEKTWLTGILRNKVIDLYRANGRRPSVLTTDLEGSARDGETEVGVTAWLDRQVDFKTVNEPQVATERSEFMRELESAITELPETMREAFRMREIQGCSTDEIVRKLDISRSNLWVLIHRAKQALSAQLTPNWAGYSSAALPMAA